MRRKPTPSSKGSGSGRGSRLRLTVLLATVAAFLLVPASQAFAAWPGQLTVKVEGTGAGAVYGDQAHTATAGFNTPIACSGPPATGTCEATLVEEKEVEAGLAAALVVARANPGSEFVGWTVAGEGAFPFVGCSLSVGSQGYFTCAPAILEGEGEDIELTATFNKCSGSCLKLTVSKTGTGTGTVTSQEPGIDCGFECSNEYGKGSGTAKKGYAGTVVILEGTADAGSKLTDWTGCDLITVQGNCRVSMSSAKTVQANFVPVLPLTVTKEGSSGTVVSNPAGIECGETCTDEFETGKKVTLTASPSTDSKFLSWKGCEKGGAIGHTCTVTMDKAKTVIAKFGPTKSLTLSKAGTGTGTVKSAPSGISCDGSCSSNVAAFTEGASVVLTAVPTKYHTFTGWSGAGCEGTGTCTVTMSEAQSVTATFAATKYALTLSKAGGGTGAVKSKPASLTCGATCSSVVSSFYAGTEVEITATPSKGSTLNWAVGSGTCTGSTSPCFVTMSAAKSLTAEFK